MDLEPFMMGLIAVGLGLTIKVLKDGLGDIGDVKIRIADCKHATADTVTGTLELEEKARSREQEVNALRKLVAELEEKESKLSHTVKSKQRAEKANARTSFKVELKK